MRLLVALCVLAALGACATGDPAQLCSIGAVELESVDERDGVFDVRYAVQGEAGSRAVISLAARKPSGQYISGYGVEVGPGPFAVVVEQKLTGRPAAVVVLLELPLKRCKRDAELPEEPA